MNKPMITILALLITSNLWAKDYTWVCEADFDVLGTPSPEKVELLSKDINTALDQRKKEHLQSKCLSDNLQTYIYDVQYLEDQHEENQRPYAKFLQQLQNQERVHQSQSSSNEAVFLHTPLDEIQIHHFSCLFSCQPPQDLSHIR